MNYDNNNKVFLCIDEAKLNNPTKYFPYSFHRKTYGFSQVDSARARDICVSVSLFYIAQCTCFLH